MKISYHNKIIVIAGGSSGIGLAVAKEFVRRNARVVIISGNEDKLKAAKASIAAIHTNAAVEIIAADIAVDV